MVLIGDYEEADKLSEKLQDNLAEQTDDRFEDLFADVVDYDDEVVDPGYEQL